MKEGLKVKARPQGKQSNRIKNRGSEHQVNTIAEVKPRLHTTSAGSWIAHQKGSRNPGTWTRYTCSYYMLTKAGGTGFS